MRSGQTVTINHHTDLMMTQLTLLSVALAALLPITLSCNDGVEKWNGNNGQKGDDATEQESVDWKSRAEETYRSIVSNYRVQTGPTAGLYNENCPKGQNDAASSFLWPYDGLISGLAAMNKLGEDVGYEAAVEKFQCYYRSSGTVAVGGYGSSTDGVNGSGDRFYDDNSIVGIELVEAWKQLGHQKYLDRCAQIVKFLESGIDDTFGGALWWCESYKNIPGNDNSNKPACANGYATWFLLSYYDVCPDNEKSKVLDMAKGLYDWLYKNLRDPSDNVYWNSKGADKVINQTKWTYNSGAMIAAGLRLYKITGDSSYLSQAKATADGAYNYFVKSRNGIALCYPTNDPWFTIQLIKSYIELEPEYSACKNYIEVFISYLDYAWEHARQSNGLFLEDWSGKTVNADRDKSLLMQAAALESLAVVANYKKTDK